ncbi:MAG: hypothetical protein JNL97_05865 [Verrucomicrobiales bacterium]|nr:hypothetical protein [Verrucomicrobiales bacterium]
MTSPRPDPRTASSRASHVALAVAIVTAVSGYFMGLRQLNRTPEPSLGAGAADAVPSGLRASGAGSATAASGEPTEAPMVVEYSRFGDSELKANARWRSSFALLRSPNAATPTPSPTPSPAVANATGPDRAATEPISARPPASDAERAQAVLRRAQRRAFDGAPPVVPHPVDATSSANCRVCHSQGLAVRDVVAPRMSHPEMGNCTQCHVEAGGSVPGTSAEWAAALAANGFEGRASVGRGSRAWPGAPPTIPHAIWMRENCASCHGLTGLVGLRTSHPERALCTQCHVPEGGFETGFVSLPDLAGTRPGAGLNPSR